MEALFDLLCFGFILSLLVFWLGIEILKQAIKEIRSAFND